MARKRGSRFRRGEDALRQLEEIEKAQQAARQGKTEKRIDNIKKSEQRFCNTVQRVKRRKDAREEFGYEAEE